MDVSVHSRLLVGVLALLGACGSGERACDLLEDVPERAGLATLEEVREVAEAAQEAESPRLRTIGDELALNLNRRFALENLSPGASIEVIQSNLDALRQACASLETTEDTSA